MGGLDLHRGGAVAGAQAAAPASQGVLSYTSTGPVGFEHLPQTVRTAVAAILAEPCFAAGADSDPVARRRPDGSCHQYQAGWWLTVPPRGDGRFVQVEARRELVSAGTKAWKPVGEWQTSTRALRLAPARPRSSSWQPRVSGGSASNGDVETTHDVARILPPEVWEPVKGAKWSAWLWTYQNGSVEEEVVAALASDERVRAFVAKRAAPSRSALPAGTWQVQALEAIVVAVEGPSVGAGLASPRARRLPGTGSGPRALRS